MIGRPRRSCAVTAVHALLYLLNLGAGGSRLAADDWLHNPDRHQHPCKETYISSEGSQRRQYAGCDGIVQDKGNPRSLPQ